MDLVGKLKAFQSNQDESEDFLYDLVDQELKEGKVLSANWTKALAHCDFDEKRAQAFYIRERVARLSKKKNLIHEYHSLSGKISRATNLIAVQESTLERLRVELESSQEELRVAESEFLKEAHLANKEIDAELEPSIRTKKFWASIISGSLLCFCAAAYFTGLLSGPWASSISILIVLAFIGFCSSWDSVKLSRQAEEKEKIKAKHDLDNLRERVARLKTESATVKESIPSSEVKELKKRVSTLEPEILPLFAFKPASNPNQ